MGTCHVCKELTELACSDCAIDLGVTVYVCSKTQCLDEHEKKCPGNCEKRLESVKDLAYANGHLYGLTEAMTNKELQKAGITFSSVERLLWVIENAPEWRPVPEGPATLPIVGWWKDIKDQVTAIRKAQKEGLKA